MIPKPGRYLADTNIYVDAMSGDQRLSQCLAAAEEVLVSPVVEGELLLGAACSVRRAENETLIARWLSLGSRLAIDRNVAALYAQVKYELRAKGRLIPDNDIWIAACAMAEGATLVTRDAHFGEVDGLAREEW